MFVHALWRCHQVPITRSSSRASHRRRVFAANVLSGERREIESYPQVKKARNVDFNFDLVVDTMTIVCKEAMSAKPVSESARVGTVGVSCRSGSHAHRTRRV